MENWKNQQMFSDKMKNRIIKQWCEMLYAQSEKGKKGKEKEIQLEIIIIQYECIYFIFTHSTHLNLHGYGQQRYVVVNYTIKYLYGYWICMRASSCI